VSRRWCTPACALGFAITALACFQATTGLIPIPRGFDPVAMRLAGWHLLARQAEASRQANAAAYIAAEGYALAAELAWWLPPGTHVIVSGERWVLTKLPPASTKQNVGLLIQDARAAAPDPAVWKAATRIATITRPGAATNGYAIYRIEGPADPAAARQLPTR
jgi:hypothetical protein